MFFCLIYKIKRTEERNMSSFDLTLQFDEVLNGNDVDALKTSLQNLMVLFENQNRNYLELKEQVKNLKLRKPHLSVVKADSVTITSEESRVPADGLVENAYELLAAIRLSRKIQEKASTSIESSTKKILDNENMKISQLYKVMDLK